MGFNSDKTSKFFCINICCFFFYQISFFGTNVDRLTHVLSKLCMCSIYTCEENAYSHQFRAATLSFRPLFDDVTRINFRFRLLVTWSSLHGRDASSHKIWCKVFHLGFVGGAMGPPPTGHEGVFVVRNACKNFVVIG